MTIESVPTTTSITVQNGTVLPAENLNSYIERYRSFAHRAAEAIIEVAATLVEAEESLSQEEFSVFCKEVELVRGGSTYKKLRKIGQHAARFRPLLKRLPNNWTTIYKLSRLSPVSFDTLSSNGLLSPFMTAREIDEAVGGKRTRPRAGVADLTISVADLDAKAMADLFEEVESLAARFNVTVKFSKQFWIDIDGASLDLAA